MALIVTARPMLAGLCATTCPASGKLDAEAAHILPEEIDSPCEIGRLSIKHQPCSDVGN